MSSSKSWRLLSLVVVMSMLLALMPAFASASGPATPLQQDSKPQERVLKDFDKATAPTAAPKATPPQPGLSTEQALAKLNPDLRTLAQTAGLALPANTGPIEKATANDPISISIIAAVDEESGKGMDIATRLAPYFVEGKVYAEAPIGGLQILSGKVLPSNLLKIASQSGILAIDPITKTRNEVEPYPADDPKPVRTFGPDDWAKLRENADKLREASLPWNEAKAFGDGREKPSPKDWFEVLPEGPHDAQGAWDNGYTGEGVLVSVLDSGVDFAHPDLMGTQKIYSSTAAFQYNGWPYIIDPFSMRAYFYHLTGQGSDFINGFSGVTYFDTSTTPELTPAGVGISTFKFTPLLGYATPGLMHTYVIANSMTKSGIVHVGTHNDDNLRDYIWGERVTILVCDPNTAGVYDTVYVDLDDDYDFRDEKPLTKADPSNPATYNNPVCYRDMSVPADGIADISGGILYFIGDGVNYIPGMDKFFRLAVNGIAPPGNGDLVAMHGPLDNDNDLAHGTLCASNVVAQGVINGMLPEFSDLAPGPGKPAAAIYGMAPDAKMVAMNTAWSYASRITYRDAYYLAAYGWDEINQLGKKLGDAGTYADTDAIQATSNSYGWSADWNDGWDFLGQVIVDIQTRRAPWLQFLFSTGNGGPGYGTTAPPSPATGIAVGASTEYGSTGWDTITDTTQIMFNDIAAFSNAGPGARGGAGVDVVAGGAYAAGAGNLNYYSPAFYGILDGNVSWDDWGGTSRSAPVALGIYALMAQAFKEKHGVWPTATEGRALMMSGATDLNYDVYKQGAGSVNGNRVTAMASGDYGVYMDSDSASWEPGDYRGTDWPYFAHVVEPDDIWNKTFTVMNDSASAINVSIADSYMQLIDSQEVSYDVTAAMVADENADNFYNGFAYWIPITAEAGMDASWYNVDIPPDTDLMVVRQIFPYDEFDANGDYVWDNRFYLAIYNWKDINGDGIVWDDKNGNGVVNFINGPDLGTAGLKAAPDLAWDDPTTEIQQWEFGRFGYNRPQANVQELGVRDPLDRMFDGLFIGLRHHPGSTYTGDTHLKYRFEFYKKADMDWLSTDVANLNVPAGGTATFQGTINVPADMPPGDYAAAIEVTDPGPLGGEAHTIIVPVAMNVVADFDDLYAGQTLGGVESYTYDADKAYNNGAMRGYFMWDWREESGDWRFFYVDVDNEPVSTPIWSEGFEGTFPPTGWVAYDLTGNGAWVQDNTRAHGGTYSAYHADDMGSQNAWLVTPQFTPSDSTELAFWQNDNWNAYYTYHGIWVSDGSGDPNDGDFVELVELGPGTEDTWEQVRVSLAAYDGTPVYVAFVYGGDYSDQWWVDDVSAEDAVYPYDPTAHVMVKDVWDDAAPHTDIDTVILGPTPSGLSYYTFGNWATNGYNPALFGPYTLDIVSQSAEDKAGRSIWRFLTTSGKNEEWLTFPMEDGLHEILQHNVLFEADQFDVVFTKTLGLLTEDEHSFDVETYLDSGTVGQVTLNSSMDLNGLVADAYLSDVATWNWTNEPIDFVSSNTIEWLYTFVVTDGINIEAWCSSPDIADIDLYLYYWTGTGWAQMASSTSGTADEHVLYTNPPDGTWFVGINDWSGPAGHFNLDLVVNSKAGGITVTGLPVGPVPANTDVTLTINYDRELDPGVTYPGAVLLGPPEAPQLKEIDFTITRLPATGAIMKDVDQLVTFAGNELEYTIDLFNLGGNTGDFKFTDPIPANTDFVNATMSCFWKPMWTENFDGVTAPNLPADWAKVDVSGTAGDWATNAGTVHPSGGGTHSAPNLAYFNSWTASSGSSTRLYRTTGFDLSGYTDAQLSFWMFHESGYTNNDYVQAQVSTDGGTSWADVGAPASRPVGSGWMQHTVDLSAYTGAGMTNVLVGFLGVSAYGNDCHIDDVALAIQECPTVVYDGSKISYSGPLPPGQSFTPVANEGFEDGVMPPAGWMLDTVDGTGWEITTDADLAGSVHSGTYAGLAYWDGNVDIWLYSPWFTVNTAKGTDLSFWARSATVYEGTPVDGHNVQLHVIGDGFDDVIWDMQVDEVWDDFVYRQVTTSLAAYAGQDVYLAWNYFEGPWTGYKGIFALDDVVMPGTMLDINIPSATVWLTVQVTDTVASGTDITNVGTLEYKHDSPAQTESFSASAVSQISTGPNFATSYKDATATAMTGGEIVYEVHVINSGTELAEVTFTDPIPAGTTYAWHDFDPPYQHLTYDDALDQMSWTGNIAPGDEWVFSFGVTVDSDPALWHTDIENMATIAWSGYTQTITATTEILVPFHLYMTPVFQKYTP